jgi:hypothetical protein
MRKRCVGIEYSSSTNFGPKTNLIWSLIFFCEWVIKSEVNMTVPVCGVQDERKTEWSDIIGQLECKKYSSGLPLNTVGKLLHQEANDGMK